MTYEGWSNYETWAANLWLMNEEPLYRDVMASAKVHNGDPYGLSEWLREFAETILLPDGIPASLASDLLHAAWSEINWYEIAETLMGETW